MHRLLTAASFSIFVSSVTAFHGNLWSGTGYRVYSSSGSSILRPRRTSARSYPTSLFASTLSEDEQNRDVPPSERIRNDRHRRKDLPPPPCPEGNPADDLFRAARRSWPVWLQHYLREIGFLRALEDALVVVGLPAFIKQYPGALSNFLDLSRRTSKISYGDHKMQFIDFIAPAPNKFPEGIVAFVHGGAWGSGKPWMYRLCALPFLSVNRAVAIIGYRTYPDADVNGQVDDIGLALNQLKRTRPDLMNADERLDALVAHSSGAHIGMLHVLEMAKDSMKKREQNSSALRAETSLVSKFIALSGIYCIPSHYEYEKGRGVDQLSALRAACGPEDRLEEASPTYRLECFVKTGGSEECVILDTGGEEEKPVALDDCVPEIFAVHGVEDDVVQYTQSCKIVDALHTALRRPLQCHEVLLEGVGHADAVLQLMNGGVTRTLVKEIIGRGKEKD